MENKNLFKPHHTLLSLFSLSAVVFLAMLLWPENGLMIGNAKLKFISWKSLTDSVQGLKIPDVQSFLQQYDSLGVDSILANDSAKTRFVNREPGIATLQFANNDASGLFTFFESLEEINSIGSVVHVLHYGDSQIESDRMTGYIRQQLQTEFGGYGPGLVAPVPITASAGISQNQSSNWMRYTAYGFDNAKAAHNRYGILASYGRFTPAKAIEEINVSDTAEAFIELWPSKMAHPTSRKFNKVSFYMGNNQHPFVLKTLINDSTWQCDTIVATSQIEKKTWTLPFTPSKLRFEFRGVDSPDVQAICLEGGSGVYVDNIALRGSSGTIFKKIAQAELSSQVKDLNTRLIILQFGGNTIPAISSEQGALDYGNYFQSQLKYLKKIEPEAAFIVVGPSDMSTSVDGVYQTFPYLEAVNDAMKKAAWAEHCAFWDMYQVMGGKDSMVSWVANDPPYAGPDYTHFTPQGARKMSELLYKSIHDEYLLWKQAETKKSNQTSLHTN